MSHIVTRSATADLAVKDLDILQAAATRCGLQLNRGAKTFKAYYNEQECAHSVTLPGKNIIEQPGLGLRTSAKLPGAFDMVYDNDSFALVSKAGYNMDKLTMFYQMEETKRAARKNGHFYSEKALPDGSFVAEVEIPAAA